MTKTESRSLLKAVENLLYARRSGNVPREQVQYDRLKAVCERLNVDLGEAIRQGTEYLKHHSIAAIMNGIV